MAAPALAGVGEPRSALPYLEQARQAAPNDARVYFNLSQVYDSLGDPALSDQMLQRAFALDPGLRRLLNRTRP